MPIDRARCRTSTAVNLALAVSIATAPLLFTTAADAQTPSSSGSAQTSSSSAATTKETPKEKTSSTTEKSSKSSPGSEPTPATDKSGTSTTSKTTSKTTSTSTSTSTTSTSTTAPSKAPENYSGGPISEWGEGVQERMDAATAEAQKSGGKLGMAILDRETGEFICNSNCDESFALASLSKLFIAEAVGYTNYTPPTKGELKAGTGDTPVEGNQDAMARDAMMRYSNNETTLQLWRRYGTTDIIDNVKERYGLSDSTMATPDWGATMSSPADIVRLLDGIVSGTGGMSEVETEYLITLMYSLPRYSYGNADQSFGIRAGLPGEKVGQKGGWYDPQTRTSAGFFGEDERYVMAVLGSYVGVNTLTEAVQTVFPAGVVRPGESEERSQIAASASAVDSDDYDRLAPGWLLLTAVFSFALGWVVRQRTR